MFKSLSNRDDIYDIDLGSGLSLRVNFTWTFVGNLVYAISQWGMLVILAKLGSPEMVGQFALGLAITAPIIIFSNLALRAVQATDAKNTYHFYDYLSLRFVTVFLAILITSIIILAAGYRGETAYVIFLFGLAKAIEAISDIFYGLFQKHERMDLIAWSMLIKGPLSLMTLSISFYITGEILWGVFGMLFVWLLVLMIYDARNGIWVLRKLSYQYNDQEFSLYSGFEKTKLLKLAWLSLPLGLTTMLVSLNTNLPRYFIERYWGEHELGIFAAIAYLMIAGNTVINALGQSASPRLAKYYATGNGKAYRTLLLKLVSVGAFLGISGLLVTLLAGREILILVYQTEYAKHVDVFRWLMVAATVSYISSFLGYSMTAARLFRIQPIILSISSLASILFCFFLIPKYGMLGAAWVTLLVIIIQFFTQFGANVYVNMKLKKAESF